MNLIDKITDRLDDLIEGFCNLLWYSFMISMMVLAVIGVLYLMLN